ncbi:MAG: phosphatase [Deltaproteobacteria bacterium]|nr:MAG: phosphatase [Deltaproteobacteria bacterium]
MKRRIDLHVHSTASDGLLTPAAVVQMAVDTGLSALSITDHDSMEGVKAVFKTRIPDSLAFVSGVEISAAPPLSLNRSGSFHVLGYGMDVSHPELNQALDAQRSARKNRNPLIVEKLQGLGFDISLEAVCEHAGDAQVGRPHIARFMLENGWAESMDEIFDRYLGKNGPAYVDKTRIPCADAIRLIRSAGGIAVLAHPLLLELEGPEALSALVGDLKAMGLGGIEAFYSGHSAQETDMLRQVARDHDLLVTGGSDYHGSSDSPIRMGLGDGRLQVPYALFEVLQDHLQNRPEHRASSGLKPICAHAAV